MGNTTSSTRSICETSNSSLGELHLPGWMLINGSTLGRKEPDMTVNDEIHTTVSIDMLNDDVLLVIFDFCRLADKGEVDPTDERDWGCDWQRSSWWHELTQVCQRWDWDRQHWWHRLTQVCQRWRSLILASSCRLNLHVVCTKGTPMAEKLAYFLHLPLMVIYEFPRSEMIRPDDERNILISLQRRDHVRRIRLCAATPALQKMIIPLHEEFPLLDSLAIISVKNLGHTGVILPRSLRAPNLRHLILKNVAIQTGTPILMTPIHLVVLALKSIPTSTHIPPEYLADLLELTPQLEELSIGFHPPISDHDVASHLLVPEAQRAFITLHRLERFQFIGTSSYLEGLLARINAPVLRLFHVRFFAQHSFGALPNLSRFLYTAAELRFRGALVKFQRYSITIEMGDMRSHQANRSPFRLNARGNQFDWQTTLASQICSAIVPVSSVIEELTFTHCTHEPSSVTRSNDNRVKWHKIFRQFSSIRTLKVPDGLVEELSLHLQPDGDEALLELLPRLQQIVVPSNAGDAFSAFIDSRRIGSHPVNLVHTRE